MTSGAGKGYAPQRDMPGNWERLTPANLPKNGFEHFKRPEKAAWRAYDAVADYVMLHRFNPHPFSIAYKQWSTLAKYSGEDKTPCRIAVNAAEAAGLLFRIDRGAAGVRDLCTLVTLVGVGETPQSSHDLAVDSEAYHERLQVRKDRGLHPPSWHIKNGRIIVSAPKSKTLTIVPEPHTPERERLEDAA